MALKLQNLTGDIFRISSDFETLAFFNPLQSEIESREMEFDDDFELPPNSDEASPPVREKKLKRLKKGVRVSPDPLLDQPESGADLDLEESNEQSTSRTGSEGLGDEGEMNPGLDSDDFGGEGEKGSGLEMNSGFDDLSGEGEVRSGSDGLDGGGDASGAKRALDFESVGEDFGERGEERSEEMLEESRDKTMEEPEKKRRSSDGGEEEEEEEKDKKKKNKRAKNGGDDSKSKDAAVKSKRRVEKVIRVVSS